MSERAFILSELAERLGGTLEGSGEVALTGIASIDQAGPDQLTFVLDARRASALSASRAGAAIVAVDAAIEAPMPLLRVRSVQAALAAVLSLVGEVEHRPPTGVHPTAVVAHDASLGEGVAVGAGAFVDNGADIGDSVVLCANVTVGPGATIGAGTVLLPGTVVEARCRIGQRCRIGANAVIGGCGFGYFFDGQAHQRTPHAGTVEIGDDVDIGACSCVDRAKFGATRVGDGTKMDNLVQVAHNAQIGRGCLLAAMVAIGGSTVVKDFAALGGHAGARDNIVIGAGARIGAFAGMYEDIPDGATILGVPAVGARQFWRNLHNTLKLSEAFKTIRQLEKRLAALESSTDHQGAG